MNAVYSIGKLPAVKRNWRTGIASLFLLVFPSPDAPADPILVPVPVQISGTVTFNGEPVSGSPIIVLGDCLAEDIETFTDADGRYSAVFECLQDECDACVVKVLSVGDGGEISSQTQTVPITAQVCGEGLPVTGIDFEKQFPPLLEFRVTFVEGTVDCKLPGSDEWIPCKVGDLLPEGTEFSTDYDGEAKVAWFSGDVRAGEMILSPLTEATLNRAWVEGDVIGAEIKVDLGEIRMDIKTDVFKADATISGSSETTSIRGTRLNQNTDGNIDTIELFEGVIEGFQHCSGQVVTLEVEKCSILGRRVATNGSVIVLDEEFSQPGCTAIEQPLDCGEDREETIFHIGVNPRVNKLPARIGLPGAETASLNQLKIQWVPPNLPEMAYINEHTNINYLTRTQGPVNAIDGRKRSTNPAIRDLAQDTLNIAATVLLDSDFENGLINTKACTPRGQDSGLISAIYGTASTIVGFQFIPFTVKQADGQRIAVATPNEGSTDQTGLNFSPTGKDDILEIIGEATHTPLTEFAPVTAENIYQQAIPFQYNAENQRNAKFGNPENAIVHSNMVIITGADASAYVPEGVRVLHDGTPITLTPQRQLTNIEDHIGDICTLQLDVPGYGNYRQITLLEGDAQQDVTIGACTTRALIQSNFTIGSTLEGKITLYKNGHPIHTATNHLSKSVECDGSEYTITAERFLDGVEIPTWTNHYTPE